MVFDVKESLSTSRTYNSQQVNRTASYICPISCTRGIIMEPVVFLFCLLITFKTSSSAYFCDNGECFTSDERCNGEVACSDGSDEVDCDYDNFWDDLIRRKRNIQNDDTDAFYCDTDSCISWVKKCDGHKDCNNGRDEENCDFGSFTARYFTVGKTRAIEWIRRQQNAEWSWNEHIHRSVVALYLGGGANFNGSSKDDELIAKQLELQVAAYLLRRQHGKVPSSDLAAYINALQVICHDPREFFGYDLVSYLKEDLETNSSFLPPFPYLVLCNANEPISEDAVIRLLNLLQNDSVTHGFILEIKALALMALSCITSNGNTSQYLVPNITEALNNLKKEQMEDGSFGNVYTTALVLQALIANNQRKTEDWNIKASIDYLSSVQKSDGSFGNFLTTYLILPLLNAKNLADVGKINCSFKRQSDVNTTIGINNEFEKKIDIKYSIFVGDEKDHWYSLMFRVPENITVLDLMTLSADLNKNYEFKIHEVRKKKYVYEISNIPNDPEHSKFWFIYQGLGNDTTPYLEQSPDKINV